jgi:hypothetical protein
MRFVMIAASYLGLYFLYLIKRIKTWLSNMRQLISYLKHELNEVQINLIREERDCVGYIISYLNKLWTFKIYSLSVK